MLIMQFVALASCTAEHTIPVATRLCDNEIAGATLTLNVPAKMTNLKIFH